MGLEKRVEGCCAADEKGEWLPWLPLPLMHANTGKTPPLRGQKEEDCVLWERSSDKNTCSSAVAFKL